jgi:hypothetical protein
MLARSSEELRMTAWPTTLLGVALAAATLAIGSAQPAGANSSHSCTTFYVPNADKINDLQAVSVLADNDVWAAGAAQGNRGPFPVLTHWNGSSWNLVYPDTCGSNCVYGYGTGVAAVSTSNVWIAGIECCIGNVAQMLHWDGTHTTLFPLPNLVGSTSSGFNSAATGGGAVWAVGYYVLGNGPAHTLVERFNGSSWQVVLSPNVGASNNFLTGVTVLSPTDVLASGAYIDSAGDERSMVLAWNGTGWKLTQFPNLLPTGESVYPNGVAASSDSNVWVADINATHAPAPLLQHFDGTSWKKVVPRPSGSNGALVGIATSSPTFTWAVGTDATTGQASVLLYDGGRHWNVVPQANPPSTPVNLLGVAAVPGTAGAWAVGLSRESSLFQGAIAERCT